MAKKTENWSINPENVNEAEVIIDVVGAARIKINVANDQKNVRIEHRMTQMAIKTEKGMMIVTPINVIEKTRKMINVLKTKLIRGNVHEVMNAMIKNAKMMTGIVEIENVVTIEVPRIENVPAEIVVVTGQRTNGMQTKMKNVAMMKAGRVKKGKFQMKGVND